MVAEPMTTQSGRDWLDLASPKPEAAAPPAPSRLSGRAARGLRPARPGPVRRGAGRTGGPLAGPGCRRRADAPGRTGLAGGGRTLERRLAPTPPYGPRRRCGTASLGAALGARSRPRGAGDRRPRRPVPGLVRRDPAAPVGPGAHDPHGRRAGGGRHADRPARHRPRAQPSRRGGVPGHAGGFSRRAGSVVRRYLPARCGGGRRGDRPGLPRHDQRRPRTAPQARA